MPAAAGYPYLSDLRKTHLAISPIQGSFSRHGVTGKPVGGTVSVYAPGAFDASRLSHGQPVSVNGQPGRFGLIFATASVVKVMIAAYLLFNHEMIGQTADLAYSMITLSDDDAANVLWGQAGGPALEPWIAAHYGIAKLGAPNTRLGRWGNTHVTPQGLVQLYTKLKADRAVWPWLGNAMHHASKIAKDGTDQFFGIPAATAGAAVKQGWADGSPVIA
jgi:hypothetical protein